MPDIERGWRVVGVEHITISSTVQKVYVQYLSWIMHMFLYFVSYYIVRWYRINIPIFYG